METKNRPELQNVLFSIAYVNEFSFKPLYFYVNLLFKLKLGIDPFTVKRQYFDICFIYNLININIDCSELLGGIFFNVPTFNSRNIVQSFKLQNLCFEELNRKVLKLCKKFGYRLLINQKKVAILPRSGSVRHLGF